MSNSFVGGGRLITMKISNLKLLHGLGSCEHLACHTCIALSRRIDNGASEVGWCMWHVCCKFVLPG